MLAGHMPAHSSSGPGHRPLKAEIRGSNPLCATKTVIETTPDHCPGLFLVTNGSISRLESQKYTSIDRADLYSGISKYFGS